MPKQLTYLGDTTARIRLYELWDEGDERSDDELALLIGCSSATVNTYRQDYRRGQDDSGIVDVAEGELPLLTIKGWMWCEPVEAFGKTCEPWGEGNKRGCVMYEMCKVAVRDGNFIACERMLEKEILP